jgi:hypothetical protein
MTQADEFAEELGDVRRVCRAVVSARRMTSADSERD